MSTRKTAHRPTLAALPELVRVEVAAEWLDCSRGVVYELARTDPNFAVRLGRLVRVRRSALAALAGVEPETLTTDVSSAVVPGDVH
jgi:excisionase family DNA binding protein